MSIDIHSNNDDLYRKAHERLEEEPSGEVWDKVAARLDKRDAQRYRQKSIHWKRTSLLLLLLLGTVLLTGVLYIATKKEAPQLGGIQQNDIYGQAGNNVPAPSRSNDSNTFSQNINQRNVYATEQNRKNSTDTDASTAFATPAQLSNESGKQMDAHSGKQPASPVQDSSVVGTQTTAQQQKPLATIDVVKQPASTISKALASTNKSTRSKEVSKEIAAASRYKAADNTARAVAKQKKAATSTGREDETVTLRNKNSAQQRSSTASTSKTNYLFNKRNQRADTYSSTGLASGKEVLLPPASLNLNGFSSPSIFRKEAVDSTTAAKADAMAASLKKESIAKATAEGSSKTVKIAPLQKHRLQLTGYASFDASEYHLDDDDDHENNNQQQPSRREDRHKIGDRENHGLSFSAGITARYQATNKLSLKSGLTYSSITINSNPQTLYTAQNGSQGINYKFVSSSGYAYIKSVSGTTLSLNDSAKTGTSQQQLQFLSIPIMAGYTVFSNRRFSVIPSLGAAANFLIGTRVNTEISEPSAAKETVTLTRLNGLQSWYPSLLADVEVQYHFKPNMSLTLIPSFRYAVSPLTQNNAVKTSPYSFGLGLGFTYHF